MNVLIDLNMIVQLALVSMIFYAAYLARKGRLERHCTVMRIAIIVQILSIAVVMLPRMVGYVKDLQASSTLSIEMWIHHLLVSLGMGIDIYA